MLARRTLGNGMGRVDEEVQENLAEARRTALHLRQAAVATPKLGPVANLVESHVDRRFDHGFEVDGLFERLLGAREGLQITDDAPNALCALTRLAQRLGHRLRGWCAKLRELLDGVVEIADHVGERIVDLVTDASRERAHRDHAVHVHDFGRQLLARRDVAQDRERRGLTVEVDGHRRDLDIERLSPSVEEPRFARRRGWHAAGYHLQALERRGVCFEAQQALRALCQQLALVLAVEQHARSLVDIQEALPAIHEDGVRRALQERAKASLRALQRRRRGRQLLRQHVEPLDDAIQGVGAGARLEACFEVALGQLQHQAEHLLDALLPAHCTYPLSQAMAAGSALKRRIGYLGRLRPTKKLPITRLTGEPTINAVWLHRVRYSSDAK